MDDLPSLARNNSAENSGMVHVYKRNASNQWELYYYIKPPTESVSNFGQNLAVVKNEDDSLSLAVSATNLNLNVTSDSQTSYTSSRDSYTTEANHSRHEGSVIIYRITEGDKGHSITRIQNITSPRGDTNDSGFGFQIALSEKYLVVSEPFKDFVYTRDNGVERVSARKGAVYVFRRASSTLPFNTEREITRLLDRSDRINTNAIGTGLAIDGDYIYVGAPNYSQLGFKVRIGAVFVFHTENNGNRWRMVSKVLSDNQHSNDLFGSSIAVVNHRVIIGSPGDDGIEGSILGNYINNASSGTGAVFVYGRNENNELQPYGYFQSTGIGSERLPDYGRNIQAYDDTFVVYSGSGFYHIE